MQARACPNTGNGITESTASDCSQDVQCTNGAPADTPPSPEHCGHCRVRGQLQLHSRRSSCSGIRTNGVLVKWRMQTAYMAMEAVEHVCEVNHLLGSHTLRCTTPCSFQSNDLVDMHVCHVRSFLAVYLLPCYLYLLITSMGVKHTSFRASSGRW
jgi:hypothetical protein